MENKLDTTTSIYADMQRLAAASNMTISDLAKLNGCASGYELQEKIRAKLESKESNMNKISVSIAMPTTGEDLEHLDPGLFEENITAELKHMFPDCPKILVNVFRHDGTGEDKIYSPKPDDDEYNHFRCALVNAVGEAFVDEASYLLPD